METPWREGRPGCTAAPKRCRRPRSRDPWVWRRRDGRSVGTVAALMPEAVALVLAKACGPLGMGPGVQAFGVQAFIAASSPQPDGVLGPRAQHLCCHLSTSPAHAAG
jgi:hypothetical protein